MSAYWVPYGLELIVNVKYILRLSYSSKTPYLVQLLVVYIRVLQDVFLLSIMIAHSA